MMDEIPQKYLCPMSSCRELMVDACQTANCGHRFCKRCLEHFFNENPKTAKCPLSGCQASLAGEDGIKYFPDRCFQREIREHCNVKCSLGQCKWVGPVGKLEDHKSEFHPSYIVKAAESSKATHVMVDAKHMDATYAMHHHLEKLTGDVSSTLGDMCHTVKVLGEALNTQKNMMDHVVRENIEAKHQNTVSTQCSASVGQPTPQEHCVTQKPFDHMMGEVVPEMDTSALTQVDRDQYLHSQQVQAMKCTTDHQQCIPGRSTITASKLQLSNQSVTPSPNMVDHYTQTMLDNHSPPPPQETKPGRSATLPQQGTAPSLSCSPPRSFSVGSEAAVVATKPDEFTCPECDIRHKELERKLATEKDKSMTMQKILKEELHLGPAKGSSQNESRKRVATVPARNLKNIRK